MSFFTIASMATYAENILKYWLEISFETVEFWECVQTGFLVYTLPPAGIWLVHTYPGYRSFIGA